MTEKHNYLLNKWKLLIEDRLNSGLTIDAWCKANGYTKHAYYYWLSRIRKESFDEAVNNLPAALQLEETHSVVEISQPSGSPECIGTSSSNPCAVIRKGSLSIDLYSDAGPLLLSRLIEALDHAQT